MARQQFEINLVESIFIAPGVKHFIFDASIPFNFKAGQFITLLIPNKVGEIIRRSYSLANPPSQDGKRIEFAASYVQNGVASELLFNLKPGTKLAATGPFGRLTLNLPHPERYILIGTGTGITPYLSMRKELQVLIDEQLVKKIIILQGIQSPQQLLYANDFREFSAQPHCQFYACYSRANKDELTKEDEYQGYVQSKLNELAPFTITDKFYLCGNPNMIDETYALLKDYQLENKQIIREKYISSK